MNMTTHDPVTLQPWLVLYSPLHCQLLHWWELISSPLWCLKEYKNLVSPQRQCTGTWGLNLTSAGWDSRHPLRLVHLVQYQQLLQSLWYLWCWAVESHNTKQILMSFSSCTGWRNSATGFSLVWPFVNSHCHGCLLLDMSFWVLTTWPSNVQVATNYLLKIISSWSLF